MKLETLGGNSGELAKSDATAELEFIAPAIIEVMEGARSVTQLGGLINEDVYQTLRMRSIDQAQRRRSLGLAPVDYPRIEIANIHQESNRRGQIDSIVLLRFRGRLRAMTIRLEHRVGRWLATAITVL
ncbi:MAG: Rv3235 family protein [Micrococcales bacterium]